MRIVMVFACCAAILAGAPAVAAEVKPAAKNDKPSYCINDKAEFYAYEDGQSCRKGYQVAGGNCRLKDGRMIAVAKDECARLAGDVALPSPAVRLTGESQPNAKPAAKPLTVKNPQP